MKFYNPFKYHIVKDGYGNIYIRKWFFGWVFLGISKRWYWRELCDVRTWCKFLSIEEAKKAINKEKFEVIDGKYYMKFYNPFKWHIVKSGEYYFVRKYSLLGKCYLCMDSMKWYSQEYKLKWCKHYSLADAQNTLSLVKDAVIHYP